MNLPHSVTWAFSDRIVRSLWAGRTSVWVADAIGEIALLWFTWTLTQSSSMVALMAFVMRSPAWLIGWAAGVVADRYSIRNVLLAANAIGASLALTLPLLYWLNLLSLPILMLLVFGMSAMRAMEAPALVTLVPQIAPESQIRMANVVFDNAKRVGRLLGQVAASALQSLLPAPLLYVMVAGALAFMTRVASRLPKTAPAAHTQPRSLLDELRAGWIALYRQYNLLLIVLCFALYNLAYAMGYWVLLPRFLGTDLGGGGGIYAIAIALFGLGSLLSNVFVGTLKDGSEKLILASFLWFGCWFSLLALTQSIPVALICVHLAGWAIPVMDIGISCLINRQVPVGNQGKAFTFFRYLAELGIALGLLIGGPLADHVGSRGALFAIPCYLTIVVALFWIFLSRKTERRSIAAPSADP